MTLVKYDEVLTSDPWRNVYWFSRMLIASDKYGAVGKDNRLIQELTNGLKLTLSDKSLDEPKILEISKSMIANLVTQRFANAKSKRDRIQLFISDLNEKLLSREDVAVFALAMELVVLPINIALESIPSDDKIYTVSTAKAYLDNLGDLALAKVVRFWDDAGIEGCLNAERAAVVREFSHLRRDLIRFPEIQTDMILTAFIQEFERRLGQKRKSRAGGSLEDVATFLFNYYKIKAEHAPDHFQADIEVDKWVRCRDKWLIGISCKRTLRERWKQVSSASKEVLSRFKIRYVWHLVTYDEDLSDDKLSALGEQRHIFYLRDDSRRLSEISLKIGLKDYVRPMSEFINDLRNAINE